MVTSFCGTDTNTWLSCLFSRSLAFFGQREKTAIKRRDGKKTQTPTHKKGTPRSIQQGRSLSFPFSKWHYFQDKYLLDVITVKRQNGWKLMLSFIWLRMDSPISSLTLMSYNLQSRDTFHLLHYSHQDPPNSWSAAATLSSHHCMASQVSCKQCKKH